MALRQARYPDARQLFEQVFDRYLAIGLPLEALRFSLYNANQVLDQAQRHREHDRSQRLVLQALTRWLLDCAGHAAGQTDTAISALYNDELRALRARLASF